MRLTKLSICIGVAASIALSAPAFAVLQDVPVTNIRTMAMGGAGFAVADDYAALYQNPAALSNVTSLKFNLLSIRGDVATSVFSNWTKFYNVYNQVKNSGGNTQEAVDSLGPLIPTNVALNGGGNVVSVAGNSWGLGVFNQSNSVEALRNRSNPYVLLSGVSEASAIIGKSFGITLIGIPMDIGLSARYFYRYELIDGSTSDTELQVGMARFLRMVNGSESFNFDRLSGTGVGFDAGVLMPLKTPAGDGKWGVVVRNIGTRISGTTTISSANASFSDTIQSRVGIGVGLNTGVPSWIPVLNGIGTFLLAADYYLPVNGESWLKGIHIGAEKPFWIFKLRGGLNQGFIVGGVGMRLFILDFNFAYNKEALGSRINIDPIDYYTFQFGLL